MNRFSWTRAGAMAGLAAGLLTLSAHAQASKCIAPPSPPEVGDPTAENINPASLKKLSDVMVPGINAVNNYNKCLNNEIRRVSMQWAPAQKKYKALIAEYDRKYQPQASKP